MLWLILFVLIFSCTGACTGANKVLEAKIGGQAPKISNNDIYGEYVSPGQLRGKVVVLYFWSQSTCGFSLKQLELFYRQNELRGLEILAINNQDSNDDVLSYAKNNSLTYILLKDSHLKLAKQYQVLDLPTIIILDRQGIIRMKFNGNISIDKLQKLIIDQLDVQESKN
jgi:peroxiredoxin